MAYESGTSTSVSKTSGVGLGMAGGRVGVGVAGATTHSTTRSITAQKVAPPQKKTLPRWALILGIMTGPIGVPILVVVYISKSKWNKNEWPKLHSAWQNSWLCHKCGNAFALPG